MVFGYSCLKASSTIFSAKQMSSRNRNFVLCHDKCLLSNHLSPKKLIFFFAFRVDLLVGKQRVFFSWDVKGSYPRNRLVAAQRTGFELAYSDTVLVHGKNVFRT